MLLRNNNKGFALLGAIIALNVIVGIIYLIVVYSDVIFAGTRLQKSVLTKQRMVNIYHYVIYSARDVDNDGYREPLKEGLNNSVPVTIPANAIDEWGTPFRYCTWDLGTLNTVNESYSNNNVTPPKDGLVFKIISAGKDKVFQTGCSAANSMGDDLVFEGFLADIQSGQSGENSGGITSVLSYAIFYAGTTPPSSPPSSLPSCPNNYTAYRNTYTTIDCYCSSSATQTGGVWGTDIYTDDSKICRAAVHAGVISFDGGNIRVSGYQGLSYYQGSTRNGVTSQSYDAWVWSFVVQPYYSSYSLQSVLFYNINTNKLFRYNINTHLWDEIDWKPIVKSSPEWSVGYLRINSSTGKLEITNDLASWYECIPAVGSNVIELITVDNTNYTYKYWIGPGQTVIIQNANHIPIVYSSFVKPIFNGSFFIRDDTSSSYMLGLKPSNQDVSNSLMHMASGGQYFNYISASRYTGYAFFPIIQTMNLDLKGKNFFEFQIFKESSNQLFVGSVLGTGRINNNYLGWASAYSSASVSSTSYWLGTWIKGGSIGTVNFLSLTRKY